MSNSIDEWLNELGLNDDTHDAVTTLVNTPPEAIDTLSEVETAVTQQSESISAEDFNAILEDNGFAEPEYDEAEEITDEDEEDEEDEYEDEDEYDENQGEGRDLDAEEDADWDALEQAGVITPITEHNLASNEEVHFHMPDGEVIDVPIIHENDSSSVEDGNSYQVRGDNLNEESVSEDALEAFQQAEENQHLPAAELLIPLNSPTLLLNDATSRFSGTEWYNEIQQKRIILAGCGGIGSWTILQLARMNPAALFMYDDDIVEIANMSGQLYSQEDVGKAKVDAMADMICSYTTMRNIYAIKDKFKATSEAGDIMICGFDNMAARTVFFNSWRQHVMAMPEELRYQCIFLDGRLSIDTLQVFCITGDNEWAIDEYGMKHLFLDSQADATQCSLKQTSYLACMIGSVIVNLFTNWVANTLCPMIPYDMPFFTEYDAQNMIFKTVK